MSSKYIDMSNRIGDLKSVENTEKHFAANEKYNYIRIETEDGKEIPLLFTDKEILRAKERAQKNQEDLPKTNWLRDLLD